MPDCPFCQRIAAGEYESWTDDPDVVWFEPLNPVTRGHLLFIPVHHVTDALASPYEAGLVMEIAARWASKNLHDPRACNLITSVGTEATQSVHHCHLHLVPRRPGDGLLLPWSGQQKETGHA